MTIETIHTTNGMEGVKSAVSATVRQRGIGQNYMRVISIGSAVVVLPDPDRTKKATLAEVFKAMGVKDKNPQDQIRTKYIVTDYRGDSAGIWALTDDQVKLLDELQKKWLFPL